MTGWRYLTEEAVGAAEGLAADEALMLHHGRDEHAEAEATLRLYTYRSHCALVGRYQSLEDEVDREACHRLDVQYGRRPTGGGAILMGGGQLAKPLFEAGWIDEIGLNVHPVLLGSGTPLFLEMNRQVDLELLECRALKGGCVLLRYKLKK